MYLQNCKLTKKRGHKLYNANKNIKIIHQIFILVSIFLILPLWGIGYYFFNSSIKSMEQIGIEQGANSMHTAQSLIIDLGENLLSIASSSSNSDYFRTAIKQKNISWIKQNIEDNLYFKSTTDFVVTTDNLGQVLSATDNSGQLTKDLNFTSILDRLREEQQYFGLINTRKGIAIIAVSKVTNEVGDSPPTGILIVGKVLNDNVVSHFKDILHIDVALINSNEQIVMSTDTINRQTLLNLIKNEKDLTKQYSTSNLNDTIFVHAYEQMMDISGQSIGFMYIEFPLTTSTNVQKNLKQMGILNGFIILLLVIIITLTLQRRILLPLKHFKTVLEQVASGSSINKLPSKIIANAENSIINLFEQLHRLSYYDYLTELPNRRFSSILIDEALREAKIKQKKVAVLYLDLDRFKNINDSLGHRTGDKLIKVVADRLKVSISEKGYVARLGGDEFIVIVPDFLEINEVEKIANNLLMTFSQPFTVDNYDLIVTSSIGVSIYPDNGKNADELSLNADIAMYRAKEQGKNKFQFYSKNMNSALVEKLKLETMLRQAIEKNQLYLVYQPKYTVDTNEIIGVEALIRWCHPDIGVISPSEFIPIAEETGLIVPIGEWVLKTACKQNKLWQKQGLPHLRIAVNISARQFQHEEIVKKVTNILNETGLHPKWLELEITESTIMHHTEDTIKTLNDLKKMGVSVSLDDFGTGYSSMSYLKSFPITCLKIDQSFIRDIDKDLGNLAIAKSIITLGHSLNFEVVAEGVENEQQLKLLKNEKCDFSQGYYHSPPVTVDTFQELLSEIGKAKNKLS